MTDADLRELERRFQEQGTVAAELDWLRARARAGDAEVISTIPDDWRVLDCYPQQDGLKLLLADPSRAVWIMSYRSDREGLGVRAGWALEGIGPNFEAQRLGAALLVNDEDQASTTLFHASGGGVVFSVSGVGAPVLPELGVVVITDDETLLWIPTSSPDAPRPLQGAPELDNPDGGVGLCTPAGEVRLLVCCYGSATLFGLRPDDGALSVIAELPALVYDPLFLYPGPSAIHLLNHGYGSAMSAVDLRTGTQRPAPHPPGVAQGYGAFGWGQVAPGERFAQIGTKAGPFLWRFADDALIPLPASFERVVHLSDDACVTFEDGVLHTRPLTEHLA